MAPRLKAIKMIPIEKQIVATIKGDDGDDSNSPDREVVDEPDVLLVVQNREEEIVENVVVIVSLDAVGKKHEYIRPGADWNIIVSNIERLQENKLKMPIKKLIQKIFRFLRKLLKI